MNFFVFIGIVTILFTLWVEYSVTNIFYRTSDTGIKIFNFSSLFNFLFHPFQSKMLWSWETLDINYPFVLAIFILLYFLYV